MNWLRKFIHNFECEHEYVFVRNIYGDEINQHNGKRSIWKCTKCGKIEYKDTLYPNYNVDNLDKYLIEKSNQYYENQQKDWEMNNRKLLNDIILDMDVEASKGNYHIDYICFLNNADFDKFKKYWKSQNIEITHDEVDNLDVEIARHKLTLSWWK